MVLVEHVFGIAQIVFDFGFLSPGQAGEHINVAANHRGFGRHGRHELELFKFAFSLFTGLGRHLGRLDLFLDLFDVRALFTFAKLFLNRLDLLVQVKITLVFFHLALDATTDFFVDIQDIDFALKLLIEVL